MRRTTGRQILILLAAAATGLAAAALAGEAAGTAAATNAVAGAATDTANTITGNNLAETFRRGGMLMWPILVCSIVMLAVFFERLASLRTGRVFPPRLHQAISELVQAGRLDEALKLCKRDRSPFARLLHTCLLRADATGFEMESALEEAGARVLYDLRRNNRPLGIISDIAPLLGLMGTVTGMINAFNVVAKAGALGRTELLAAGISEALLTTAFGLMVAVPAVLMFHYCRGKADGLLRSMEDACLDLMTELRRNRKAG